MLPSERRRRRAHDVLEQLVGFLLVPRLLDHGRLALVQRGVTTIVVRHILHETCDLLVHLVLLSVVECLVVTRPYPAGRRGRHPAPGRRGRTPPSGRRGAGARRNPPARSRGTAGRRGRAPRRASPARRACARRAGRRRGSRNASTSQIEVRGGVVARPPRGAFRRELGTAKDPDGAGDGSGTSDHAGAGHGDLQLRPVRGAPRPSVQDATPSRDATVPAPRAGAVRVGQVCDRTHAVRDAPDSPLP